MPNTAVVRIYATMQEPDYDSPWQARTPSTGTGSGVLIESGLILTGAHVVADATFIQVQKISEPNKAIAVVECICHDCDLALLRVTQEDFAAGIKLAEIGDLPELRDRVSVVGFPVGGEEVSVTEGVVSRIEVQRYSHSQRHLLAVTVDAAINKGNSGGPVFKDGKVAGIAFQKLTQADNIGEMVPAPVIQHFLKAAKGASRVSVPGLGITVQGLENPALRSKLDLAPDQSGVLVLSAEVGNSAYGHLKAGDAILEIDAHVIANNGTIRYRDQYRTRYDVLLGERSVGETITMKVLRDGSKLDVAFELKPLRLLVPRDQYEHTPPYFIYGGLVFQKLSRDFLATWDTWWDKAPKEFLHKYYSGSRTGEKRDVIILTQILADEINVGYEDLYSESVETVNGHTPQNMADFVAFVDGATDYVEIRTSSKATIVFKPDEAQKANVEILERYRISSDRSADLSGDN